MFDLNDPVELYRSTLKDAHARHTADHFEELVAQSGIDIEQNAATVEEAYRLEKAAQDAQGSKKLWTILRITLLASMAACFLMSYVSRLNIEECLLWLAAGVGAGLLVLFFVNGKIGALVSRIQELEAAYSEKHDLAWSQMEPLNNLHGWEAFGKLLKKTFPLIELDSYLSEGRLLELYEDYGLDEAFNQSRSTIFTHSGVLGENPFIFAQTLDHWMGTKAYHGSLNISWVSHQRDSQGRLQTIRHNQTLRATVHKPFPEYIERSTLLYANKAAPDLSFSRQPSALADAGDGFIGKWRKKRALKKLKAKSQDLTDDSEFTLMANHEFETLFNGSDRDHEVQFRMLFTPLAQQMMLKLLRDKETGYGDSFTFQKDRMINMIIPEYLIETDISAMPGSFHFFDLNQARAHFNEYHNELFKGFFFAFAPLLLIPVYHEVRARKKAGTGAKREISSLWEHEAIANHMGEDEFAHADSITRNLIKTHASKEPDGTQSVEITAHGYAGFDQIDYVQVLGGDGNHHTVSVPWVQYVPVEKSSRILVCHTKADSKASSTRKTAATDWQSRFAKRGIDPTTVVEWRSMVASAY